MKIAIPVENEEVFQHFGHAGTFRIYDVREDGTWESEDVTSEGEGHDAVAEWLSGKDVDLVICGGIGDGAVGALRDMGIMLCSGAEGKADECLSAFLQYEQAYGSDATCPGHEGGCGGGCGGGECGCGGGCSCGCHSAKSDYIETRTFTEITTLTAENFEAEVMNDPGLICIDFWAEWCAPCKMMAPVFESLNTSEPKVKFCRVNVDEQQELASLFDIESIPTFALVQDRRTLTGFVGATDEATLRDMIHSVLPEEN